MTVSSETLPFSHPLSPEAAGSPCGVRLTSPLARMLRAFADWRRRRADMATLGKMTDRDLRDIGLSRIDVAAIAGDCYRFET